MIMIKCLKCGGINSDEAKFCRHCGEKLQPVTVQTQIACPKCAKSVDPSAKFCRHCGQLLSGGQSEETDGSGISVRNKYITWSILPGQLAVKVDEEDMAAYGNPKWLRGLYVAPGTKALVFADGKYAATLDSGRYDFRNMEHADSQKDESEENSRGFLRCIADFIVDGLTKLFSRNPTSYSVLLVKGSQIPLIYELQEVPTKDLRCDVALHLLCTISNLNDFYTNLMLDRKFISVQTFSDTLVQSVASVVHRALASTQADAIDHNQQLADQILSALQQTVQNVYPYVALTKIIDITARQQEVERIRQLREDLYIAEQELEQTQLRNDFLNRLQNAQYSNQLQAARSRVEFENLMRKVDQDSHLSKDEMDRFVMMLTAEQQLRQARSKTETDNALDQLKKSRMLSQQELDDLAQNIAHEQQMKQLANGQIIAMATLQNERALDQQRLNWEIEIGNLRIENELQRRRILDAYADERAQKKREWEKQEMDNDLNILRTIIDLKAQEQERIHRRDVEMAQLKLQQQQLELTAKQETVRIYAGMSAEQIMAANPDVTPEAAAALAEKFKAQAASAQSQKIEALMGQHSADLKELLLKQMDMTRDVAYVSSGMKDQLLNAKQQELDRVHADSEHHQDRLLAGMQSTVTAVSGAVDHIRKPSTIFCSSCGAKNETDSFACSQCGKTL